MAFVDLTTLGLETYGVHTFKRSPKRTARRTIHVQAPNGDVLEAQWTSSTVWFYKNGKELFTDVFGNSWGYNGQDFNETYSGGTPVVIVGRRAYYGTMTAQKVSRSTRIHAYVNRFNFDSGVASTIYQAQNWINSGATTVGPTYTAAKSSAIAYNPVDKHLYVVFSGWARAMFISVYRRYLTGLYKISLEGSLEDTLWSTTGTDSNTAYMGYPCVAVESDYVYMAYGWPTAPRVAGVGTAGGTPTVYVSESSGTWRVGPHGLIAYGLSLRAVDKATEAVSHTWDMSSYCTDLSLAYVLQKKAAGSYLLLAWTGSLLKLFELKSDETVVELSSRSLSSFGLPAGYNLGGLELEDSYPALPQKAFFSTGRETFEACRPGWEVI